jgi:hypothetical protein
MKKFILLAITVLGLFVFAPSPAKADDGVIVRFPGGTGFTENTGRDRMTGELNRFVRRGGGIQVATASRMA